MIATLWIGLAQAAAPPLAETYVLEMVQASTAKVPVIGKTRNTTVSLTLVRTSPSAAGPVLTRQTCSVRLESPSPLARTVVPDAFVASLPVVSGPARIGPQANGSWTFDLDLGMSHVGYDPALSPLGVPRSAGDVAVVDQDGDGRPGSTIELTVTGMKTFGIEVAQRSRAVLEGVLHADGSIDGQVRVSMLEQTVLGADHKLLLKSPELTPDDARSSFTMTPADAATTCADVSAGR